MKSGGALRCVYRVRSRLTGACRERIRSPGRIGISSSRATACRRRGTCCEGYATRASTSRYMRTPPERRGGYRTTPPICGVYFCVWTRHIQSVWGTDFSPSKCAVYREPTCVSGSSQIRVMWPHKTPPVESARGYGQTARVSPSR